MINPFQLFSKRYHYLPVFAAFIVPIIIGLWFPRTLGLLGDLIFIPVFFLPFIAVTRIIVDCKFYQKSFDSVVFKYILPIPGGIVYNAGLKINGVPITTLGLLLLNSAVFVLANESFKESYAFMPINEVTRYQTVASFFVSAFLHANIEHLLGNMLFLWVFGSVLESRFGSRKLLAMYIAFIVVSKLFCVVLLFLKNGFVVDGMLDGYHSLGASGAIAGLMGVFVIRCYFAKVSIAIPIPLSPVGAIPVSIHGTTFMALFFALQVAGSENQFTATGGVNYWAHTGGYAAGMLLGYLLTSRDDVKNEALEYKATQLAKDPINQSQLKVINKEILRNSAENEKALVELIEMNQWNDDEAGKYYVRLMEVYLQTNMAKADELFIQHYPNLEAFLSEKPLFKLGSYFYRKYQLKEASRCLELAAEKDGPLAPKILLILAKTYQAIGNTPMAEKMLQKVIAESTEALFKDEATRLLKTH